MGKTNPLNDDDLADFVALQADFGDRPEELDGQRGRHRPDDLRPVGENPNDADEDALRSPEEIIDEIAALDAESAEVLEDIRGML